MACIDVLHGKIIKTLKSSHGILSVVNSLFLIGCLMYKWGIIPFPQILLLTGEMMAIIMMEMYRLSRTVVLKRFGAWVTCVFQKPFAGHKN